MSGFEYFDSVDVFDEMVPGKGYFTLVDRMNLSTSAVGPLKADAQYGLQIVIPLPEEGYEWSHINISDDFDLENDYLSKEGRIIKIRASKESEEGRWAVVIHVYLPPSPKICPIPATAQS